MIPHWHGYLIDIVLVLVGLYSVRTLYIPNQRRHIETENHNPESHRLGDLSCPRRGVGLRWAVRSRNCRPQIMSVVAPDELVHIDLGF
jgi:hypothetical protein